MRSPIALAALVAILGIAGVQQAAPAPASSGPPTITQLSPASGITAGGNQVSITGPGVGQTTELTVDGTAISFVKDDPGLDTIRFTAPAHSAGSVSIAVADGDGTSSPAAYTYVPTNSEVLTAQQVWPGNTDPTPMSIDCVSRDFCLAAGSNRAYRWNGRAWRALGELASGPLGDRVSCASASLCLVRAGSGLRTWNGKRLDPTPRLQSFVVSCPPNAKACVSIDQDGQTSLTNGRSRQEKADVNLGGSIISSLSCPTERFCLLSAGTKIWRFNGRRWRSTLVLHPASEQRPAPDGHVTKVSCPSPSFCVAVDNRNDVFTMHGNRWSKPHLLNRVWWYPSFQAAGNAVTGLDCAARSFCIAVEGNGRAFRFNGRSWVHKGKIDSANFGIQYSVSCPARTFCQVANVGDVLHYDGKRWTRARTIDPVRSFTSHSCAASDFCVFVGAQGAATTTFDGKAFSRPVPVLPFAHDRSPQVSCASVSFCAVVSGGWATSYNGRHWSTPVPTGVPHPSDLSCASRNLCIIVSRSVTDAAVWNGKHWRSQPTGNPEPFGVTVSCAGDRCVAAGADGAVQVFRHGSWSKPAALAPPELVDISCATSAMCMAVSSLGVAYRYDGHSWSPGVGLGPDLTSVSCPRSDYCVADRADASFIYDGHGWSRTDYEQGADGPVHATDVSCGAPRDCVAASSWPPDEWSGKEPKQVQGLASRHIYVLR